jgi:hypothetical protein
MKFLPRLALNHNLPNLASCVEFTDLGHQRLACVCPPFHQLCFIRTGKRLGQYSLKTVNEQVCLVTGLRDAVSSPGET